jgi:hypothetical protein
MRRLLRLVFLMVIVNLPALSYASKQPQACTLVSGTLVQLQGKPLFKFNTSHKFNTSNYPMTHTQFFIRSGNGENYKIVVDNLFYKNLSLAQAGSVRDVGIIDDFKRSYHLGSTVEACGKVIHTSGDLGLHFVHPSGCEQTKFNGFLRINGIDVTNNLTYCGGCSCKVNSRS